MDGVFLKKISEENEEAVYYKEFVVPFRLGKKYSLGEKYVSGPVESLILEWSWTRYAFPIFLELECKEDGNFWINGAKEKKWPKVFVDGFKISKIQKQLEFGSKIEIKFPEDRDLSLRFERRETDMSKVEGRIEYRRRLEYLQQSFENKNEEVLPDLPELAIAKIWSFLDFESLKICRLVERNWDLNLTPMMLQKAKICLNLDTNSSYKVDQFICDTEGIGEIQTFRLNVGQITGNCAFDKKLKDDILNRLVNHPPLQNITDFFYKTYRITNEDWAVRTALQVRLGNGQMSLN